MSVELNVMILLYMVILELNSGYAWSSVVYLPA